MTWFKVDDGFYDHPKVAELSMAARGLWVTAATYCSRHLTDGVITARQVRVLGGTRAQVQGLVSRGLWVRFEDDSGAVCYRFHGWFDMQPSRKEVEESRERERERKSKWRAKKFSTSGDGEMSRRDKTGDKTGDSLVLSRVSRPDPSRPDLSKPPTPSGVGPPLREDRAGAGGAGGSLALDVPVPDAAPPKPAKARRGCRLPEGWEPKQSTVDTIRREFPLVTTEFLLAEHRQFTDYWAAATGQKATKLDWEATWRNWLRRALKNTPQAGKTRTRRSGTRPEDWLTPNASDSTAGGEQKTIIDQDKPPF